MAAVTSVGETPAPTAASRPRGMHARRRRRLNIFRYVVFTVFGLFFLLSLLRCSGTRWRKASSAPDP